MKQRLGKGAVFVCVLVAVVALAGCGGQSAAAPGGASQTPPATAPDASAAAPFAFGEAWARPAEAGGTTAVFLRLTNNTDRDDELVAVATDVTADAQLHESRLVGTVMHMDHVGAIPIAAGATVELKPGGLHIMLMHVGKELLPGDSVSLQLQFRHAGTQQLDVPVRDE